MRRREIAKSRPRKRGSAQGSGLDGRKRCDFGGYATEARQPAFIKFKVKEGRLIPPPRQGGGIREAAAYDTRLSPPLASPRANLHPCACSFSCPSFFCPSFSSSFCAAPHPPVPRRRTCRRNRAR